MTLLNLLLRQSAKACLATGLLPDLIQQLRTKRCLSVLTYHSVIEQPLPFNDWSFLDSTMFRRQLAYLRKHFNILPLPEAVELLRNDKLQRPTAVVTFDDGFLNNFTVAFPILQEYAIPSTIFLATDLIGSEKTVWFTRLILALQATNCPILHWNDNLYPLANEAQKAVSSARLQEALKVFPADALETELRKIEILLSVPSDPGIAEDSPFRMLDQEAIRIMVESGLVEFGAHTCRHAILSRLPSREIESQIRRSVRGVEKLTGKPCLSFAYPNGARQDFDLESQRVLRESGIQTALTMVPGPNRPTTDLLELHRYPIGSDTPFSRFKLMVHNVV